ncbi:hypothetical protein EVAR_94130_1 [Eumeta japonica]|uniref:DH domain-containing protein n=1 Tax=Eumeta variegata TaxID=151549 RepID=A0A4C1U6Y7_EUMVA|nr:hypothetical protein EVAR_94130_1 [Eumeta japonica]
MIFTNRRQRIVRRIFLFGEHGAPARGRIVRQLKMLSNLLCTGGRGAIDSPLKGMAKGRRDRERHLTDGSNAPRHAQSMDTRTHVVVELYETEKSYVDNLEILVKALRATDSYNLGGLYDTVHTSFDSQLVLCCVSMKQQTLIAGCNERGRRDFKLNACHRMRMPEGKDAARAGDGPREMRAKGGKYHFNHIPFDVKSTDRLPAPPSFSVAAPIAQLPQILRQLCEQIITGMHITKHTVQGTKLPL